MLPFTTISTRSAISTIDQISSLTAPPLSPSGVNSVWQTGGFIVLAETSSHSSDSTIGYDADGRTLSINTAEAITIRTLYDLYETHKTVRAVKGRADTLDLRTKVRHSSDGTIKGGGPFTRGHIHQILTNPLYAGRIRHRKLIHDGQHPALIDPDRWDQVQILLQDGATKDRRSRSKTVSSTLCGKLPS